ncbi:MAG: response regulator [Longimicrobiales bacterium]
MRPKRVLIVEDNPDTRTIYSLILRHHGYDAVEATDGSQGVERAIETRPDLILMDLSMPILDGWGANEKLKEDERTAGIPVVMVTAHAAVVTEKRVKEAGFTSLLLKPLETKRLLREVERLIGPATNAVS